MLWYAVFKSVITVQQQYQHTYDQGVLAEKTETESKDSKKFTE